MGASPHDQKTMTVETNIHSGAGLGRQWASLLQQLRNVRLDESFISNVDGEPEALQLLELFGKRLQETGHEKESVIFAQVKEICLTSPAYGGLGLTPDKPTSQQDAQEVGFLLSAWLESLNANDRALSCQETTQKDKPPGRPAMNVTEKIFAIHNVQGKEYVKAGDMIRVSIDWVMASEASWSGMKSTYDQLGDPGIFRNDRFWLAGDHVVDPRVNSHPTIRKLIDASEHARKLFKMTEYQGLNYTIMHTEFFRERAQPGMLIIGSDSHTCSSGAVGCLAIGLGAADVTMGLVTGELLIKVPEVVNIEFVGCPKRGIGGKDVILYVLQQLKRNTVAADRVVEYTGPGLEHLSPDARFAIANMTTEFGGITGIVVPDYQTKAFIDRRKVARYKTSSKYFRTDDPRSVYAETFVIDLNEVKSFVARYPNPDDVVPVTDPTVLDMSLDGCFIGACTTAEEDLILAALVLEQGLQSGLRPVQDGKKRKVVPGSLPILDTLRKSGLAAIYEEAGFEVGIPGCSYCVGMSADKAGQGEVWLSSQNRNFENRMGQGSIGNLASAATVAASSFEMRITDPQNLIEQIPDDRWQVLRGRGSGFVGSNASCEPDWVEPAATSSKPVLSQMAMVPAYASGTEATTESTCVETSPHLQSDPSGKQSSNAIRGKVQRLGDFIDTDALAPAQFLISCRTPEAIGAHCLEYTHPNFRARVKEGYNVVVAGKAFGCGSSREQAVLALLGCGVKCVIAESFAFIYARNQPSLGLLGIELGNKPEFFAAAQDGEDIEVDCANDVVRVGGQEFGFKLSDMEKRLIELGGVTPAFLKFGKAMFDELSGKGQSVARSRGGIRVPEQIHGRESLQW